MKQWIINAEVDWDASHIETITVNANTERKARIIASEKLKKKFFAVSILSVSEVDMRGAK